MIQNNAIFDFNGKIIEFIPRFLEL